MAEGTQSPEDLAPRDESLGSTEPERTPESPRDETPPVEPEPTHEPTEPDPVESPTPVTPVEDVRYSFMVANRQMEIRKRAETTAERAIQEEQRRGAWFNPLAWARKVRMRIFEEYYRQQYIRRSEDAMIDNNNSYLEFDVVRNALQNANANIDQERAAGEAKISELGEGGTSQAEILRGGREEIREATGELKALLMDDIIRPIVNGEITDYAQVQERLRQFVQNNPDNQDIRELFGADANRYGEATRYFATDILELGQRIRIDIEAHRFAIEELDSRVTINLANADWAAESQTRFTLADRFIARAQQRRLTGLMGNPAFVGAVTSIGVYGAMRAVGYGGSAAQFVVPGSGVLTGALFAGLRRNYDLKVDRASDQRERAYNFEAGPGAPRREALRRYNYDIASVDELLDGGRERFDLGIPGNTRGIQELLTSDLSQEANREALNRRIAEIRTRLDFSGAQNIDLLTFRGEHQVQQGRLELIRAIAQGNLALRNAGMTQEELDEVQSRLAGEWNTHFTQDRQQQDRSFAIYRYRNAAGAAVFGGVAGFAGGLAAKEVLELASSATGIDIGGAGLARDGGAENRFRNLHEGGGQTRIGELDINVGPDHAVTINEGGQTIVDGGWKITENGALQARLDSVPDGVLDQFKDKGFQIESGPEVVENLIEGAQGSVPSSLAGQEVLTPPGTEWITDDQGNFDLIVSGRPDKILLNDAGIVPDGKISFDSATSILNESNIDSETIRTEVLGPDGTWTKEATNVHNREWYSYDQPGSQQNELRFHTFKDGERVTLDMTNMQLGYQKGLNPNPIDVQQVIANHEAGWYFTTTNAQQDGLFISDGADGIFDGKLTLDPNANLDLKIDPADPNSMALSEASKIILNEQALQKYPDGDIATELYARQDVFNLGQDGKYGFIEAGRMQARPEGNVLQSFATIRGLGPVPESIETTVFRFDTPPVIDHIPTVEIVPPPGPREIPIIPFPFSPRHPLEPLRRPPDRIDVPPYGYGYHSGELSPELAEFYSSRRSERLRNNPDATLDPSIEIPDYFSRMSPEYIRRLEDYLAQEGMRETMSENANLVIAIPVYDLGEGQIIRNTMEQYLLQIDRARNKNAIDSSRFEIILFLNHPRRVEGDNPDNPRGREALDAKLGHSYRDGADGRVRSEKPENYDTEEVIRQFKEEHPEIKVRVMTKEFETRPQWSDIIKPLYDIALLRSARRQNPYRRDISIVTNDADVVTMSPTYIKDLLDAATENEDASKAGKGVKFDAFAGKTDMPNHGFKEAPGFLTAMRFWQFTASQLQRRLGWNPPTQGRNTVIRGSAYAAIGGVNNQQGYWVDAGADTELGKMISIARGGEKTIKYINRAWLNTDPRREFGKWQQGTPLVWAWDEWAAMNVYGDDWKNQIKIANPDPSRISKENLEGEINANMRTWGLSSDSKELRRSLVWIGLKFEDYHFEEFLDSDGVKRDKILIDNIDGVVTNLEAYIKERRWEATEKKIKKNLTSSSSPRAVP